MRGNAASFQADSMSESSVEEVFIGGLLHDIGKLFLNQYFPDQYAIAIKLAATANISIWGRRRPPWASAMPWSENGSLRSGEVAGLLTAGPGSCGDRDLPQVR